MISSNITKLPSDSKPKRCAVDIAQSLLSSLHNFCVFYDDNDDDEGTMMAQSALDPMHRTMFDKHAIEFILKWLLMK